MKEHKQAVFTKSKDGVSTTALPNGPTLGQHVSEILGNNFIDLLSHFELGLDQFVDQS